MEKPYKKVQLCCNKEPWSCWSLSKVQRPTTPWFLIAAQLYLLVRFLHMPLPSALCLLLLTLWTETNNTMVPYCSRVVPSCKVSPYASSSSSMSVVRNTLYRDQQHHGSLLQHSCTFL